MLGRYRRQRLFFILFQSPAKADNACQQHNSAQGDKTSVQIRQSFALVEVDQAVDDGDDVVDAEDKRIENTCADQLQSTVHVV